MRFSASEIEGVVPATKQVKVEGTNVQVLLP
jgi:hypothetical protein